MAIATERRANPAALGLAGFGLTTVLLSLVNAGILPAGGEGVVLPLAIFFGGVIQVIAGILEYNGGNTFGCTVFTSYGAFWMWFGFLAMLGSNGVLDLKTADSTIGACLLLWALLTLGFLVASFRLTRHLVITVLAACVTLVLLGFWKILGASWLCTLGGWAGILTGLLAMYGSSAVLINEEMGRNVLPLGIKASVAADAAIEGVAIGDGAV
jgi:succinate-acetate transporter protein